MKFNKKVQYAILFSLYLSRAGRATIKDASLNLNLSKSFLEQMARKLRLNGVVKSFRGPGGGYELNEGVTILQITSAVSQLGFIQPKELRKLKFGAPEERAMAYISITLGSALMKDLKRNIRSVMHDFTKREVDELNRLDSRGLEN